MLIPVLYCTVYMHTGATVEMHTGTGCQYYTTVYYNISYCFNLTQCDTYVWVSTVHPLILDSVIDIVIVNRCNQPKLNHPIG